MKKSFLIITSIFISLLSNPVFAQASPGDDPELTAPIDDYVWVLALVGLAFIFLKVKNYTKQIQH